MTESDGYVVGLFSSAGAHVEQSDSPRSCLAVESTTAEDRHGCSGRVESNTSRVEELSSLRRADIEQPARLQEELPLLGKERWKSGEIDDLLICFDLREVRVERKVGRQRGRHRELGIDPELPRCLRWRRPRAGRIVGRGDESSEHVRSQLDRTVAADVAESDDVTRS